MNSTRPFDIFLISEEKNISFLQDKNTRSQLVEYINHLIIDDFEALINILYRIDINEEKLKDILRQHPDTETANIIADLIINRQIQKLRTRQLFSDFKDIPEDEKW
ncbi:MAG: hypothetical protein KF829_07415 [Ferruginibacter sp.]|nr:hypothetical protein [Ferruginibacter sp.]